MDMEVAGQWRRQWTGAAEYGKIIEGGITRHIARAMEVVHASAPGARMRIMRAAFHSSAAPGTPASSYMLHSSQRVISSGSNLLQPPTYDGPMEISSTPLRLTAKDGGNNENYKVTEPDDSEISEPSKWRSSKSINSIRMPSEESSSVDNISIIDLDSKSNDDQSRIYSQESEDSDILVSGRNDFRSSPLLDAPINLSTLKFKSILNSSNEWNQRRKSFSFEDTPPLDDVIMHSNDVIAMESSTDSGIWKSTEIVNTQNDNKHNNVDNRDCNDKSTKETFQDWLSRNRNIVNKENNRNNRSDVSKNSSENNYLTLQSAGKISIALPTMPEVDNVADNDCDRKIKKVGFCKTELHFAAEPGKVNIIATDEKPPPSNDFKKKRTTFIPLNLEKPITLFGETTNSNPIRSDVITHHIDVSDFEENSASTKSILKNKIPKPKPYILGENMQPEKVNDSVSDPSSNVSAVSLLNRQFQTVSYSNERLRISSKNEHGRTNDQVLNAVESSAVAENTNISKAIKNNIDILQNTSVVKPKTRKLRDSDLAYFGIKNNSKSNTECPIAHLENKSKLYESFDSVRLVRKISDSVCNSDIESDTPEYQNLPVNTKYFPTPTPRVRARYESRSKVPEEIHVRPITIQETKESQESEYRRPRHRRLEDKITESRSISEPPNLDRHQKSKRSHNNLINYKIKEEIKHRETNDPEEPLYSNINCKNISDQNIRCLRSEEQPGSIIQTVKSRTDKRDGQKQKIYDKKQNPKQQQKGHKSVFNQSSEYITQAKQLVIHEKSPKRSEKVHSISEIKTKKTPEISIIDKNVQHRRSSQEQTKHRIKENSHQTSDSNTSTNSKRKSRHPSLVKRDSSPKNNRESPTRNQPASITYERIPSLSSRPARINTDFISIPENPKSSKSRSKYVINYDDKNGTVSSICKMNKNASKKQFIPHMKDKQKIPLLQFIQPERHRKGFLNTTRKWRNKIQENCFSRFF